MGENNVLWLALKGTLFFFFLAFFFYPLALVLARSLSSGPEIFALFLEFVSSRQQILWNSFYQAAVSTIFSVIVALPLAYVVAKRSFPGKKIVKALSLIPFVFPSILVVLSFVVIFGNNGWVNSFLRNYAGFSEPIQFLYGFSGIILAHVFYNFPIVMRFVSDAWENLDVSMKEAAKTLGATPLNVFLNVTLPQLLPSILASASLVFIFTFMSFTIVLTLGGIQFTTLEVEIFRQVSRNLDFALSSSLAVFQFALLSVAAFLYLHFSKKYAFGERLRTEKPIPLSLGSLRGFIEALVLAAGIFFIALPLASLFAFAFTDPATGNFTLKAFSKIFSSSNVGLFSTSPLDSIGFSLFLAIIASFTATLIGLLASLKRSRIPFLEYIINATLAISVITLGFGYFLGYGSGNLLIIALGHSVLAFPFAFRIIKNSLDKIDPESIDAAKTLGATDFAVFRSVQLPRIRGALFASTIFSFAVSLGELGLVLILYDGVYATMPVYIYRLLTTYDLFAATAMGLVLVAISFLSFYALELFSAEAKVF